MGLIKWTSQPKEDATWEQLSEVVVLQFPDINFYRQGFGEGKGNVARQYTSSTCRQVRPYNKTSVIASYIGSYLKDW